MVAIIFLSTQKAMMKSIKKHYNYYAWAHKMFINTNKYQL